MLVSFRSASLLPMTAQQLQQQLQLLRHLPPRSSSSSSPLPPSSHADERALCTIVRLQRRVRAQRERAALARTRSAAFAAFVDAEAAAFAAAEDTSSFVLNNSNNYNNDGSNNSYKSHYSTMTPPPQQRHDVVCATATTTAAATQMHAATVRNNDNDNATATPHCRTGATCDVATTATTPVTTATFVRQPSFAHAALVRDEAAARRRVRDREAHARALLRRQLDDARQRAHATRLRVLQWRIADTLAAEAIYRSSIERSENDARTAWLRTALPPPPLRATVARSSSDSDSNSNTTTTAAAAAATATAASSLPSCDVTTRSRSASGDVSFARRLAALLGDEARARVQLDGDEAAQRAAWTNAVAFALCAAQQMAQWRAQCDAVTHDGDEEATAAQHDDDAVAHALSSLPSSSSFAAAMYGTTRPPCTMTPSLLRHVEHVYRARRVAQEALSRTWLARAYVRQQWQLLEQGEARARDDVACAQASAWAALQRQHTRGREDASRAAAVRAEWRRLRRVYSLRVARPLSVYDTPRRLCDGRTTTKTESDIDDNDSSSDSLCRDDEQSRKHDCAQREHVDVTDDETTAAEVADTTCIRHQTTTTTPVQDVVVQSLCDDDDDDVVHTAPLARFASHDASAVVRAHTVVDDATEACATPPPSPAADATAQSLSLSQPPCATSASTPLDASLRVAAAAAAANASVTSLPSSARGNDDSDNISRYTPTPTPTTTASAAARFATPRRGTRRADGSPTTTTRTRHGSNSKSRNDSNSSSPAGQRALCRTSAAAAAAAGAVSPSCDEDGYAGCARCHRYGRFRNNNNNNDDNNSGHARGGPCMHRRTTPPVRGVSRSPVSDDAQTRLSQQHTRVAAAATVAATAAAPHAAHVRSPRTATTTTTVPAQSSSSSRAAARGVVQRMTDAQTRLRSKASVAHATATCATVATAPRAGGATASFSVYEA